MAVAESSCVFSFKINSALINSAGNIFLKLSITTPSSSSLLNAIVIHVGDSDEEVKGHTFTTNAVTVSTETQTQYHHVIDDSITFHLPKGLCREEAGSDVVLLVEAWDATQNAKVAEAELMVYPWQKNLSEAAGSKEIYRHSGDLLLIKRIPESITIYIGKLKYEAYLRMLESPSPIPSTPSPIPSPMVIPSPEPEPEPSPPPAIPQQEPTPAPVRPPEPRKPTPPPPPPPLTKKVTSVPQRMERSGSSGLVAPPNHEELVVIVHAASGLPSLPNGSLPRPLVLGKIQSGAERKQQAPAPAKRGWQATRATVDTTTGPRWGETLYCKIPAVDARATQADVLQLRIADKPSKIEIVTFDLPVTFFQAFYQYHLDLVQTVLGSSTPIHLYISVYRKLSALPEKGEFSFCSLEVRLQSLDQELPSPVGSLMAVAKIVPDYEKYRDTYKEHTELLSLQPVSVECPVPHPSSFLIPRRAGKHQGYDQLWLSDPSSPQRPTWNHSFVFCDERELASMFVSAAALVIELYNLNSGFDGTHWSPQNAVGLAVVLLDNRVYNALTSKEGTLGVRVPHIPLQSCTLETAHGKQNRSLSLVLRLLASQVPDQPPSVANLYTLPVLEGIRSPSPPPDDLPPSNPTWGGLNPESAITPPTTPPPEPLYEVVVLSSKKLLKLQDGDLPPSDALQNILQSNPEDRLVQPGEKATSTKGLIPTRLPPSPLPSKQEAQPVAMGSRGGSPGDQALMSLIDMQQREMDSSRRAMKRMGEEIVALQDTLARLEVDNSQLRRQASLHEDAARAMVADAKLQGMSRAELLEKYVTLKQSLSKQVAETTNYREKLLHAQNSLIQHNDREKKYLDQQEAFVSQSKLLQERQEKVRKLEQACREQEKALEKMDKALSARSAKQSVRFKNDDPEKSALSAENARLKAEIEHLRATSSPKGGATEETEKIRMQFMLERAEGRVASLEKELLEKAKEWGKERASISFRFDERPRVHSLPPLPYYDRGKLQQESSDPYTDRSYGNRRPRLGYGTPTRLSPLY